MAQKSSHGLLVCNDVVAGTASYHTVKACRTSIHLRCLYCYGKDACTIMRYMIRAQGYAALLTWHFPHEQIFGLVLLQG